MQSALKVAVRLDRLTRKRFVRGSVRWSATPSGEAIDRVEFLIDGVLRWTERQDPYVFNGDDGLWDSRLESNGFHALTTRAVASDGRVEARTVEVNVVNGEPVFFLKRPAFGKGSRVRVGVHARRGTEVVLRVRDRNGRLLAKERTTARRGAAVGRLELHGWRGQRPLRVTAVARGRTRVARMGAEVRMPAARFVKRPVLRVPRSLEIRASAVAGSSVETVVRNRRGRVLGMAATTARRSGRLLERVRLPLWSGQRRLRVVLRAAYEVEGETVVRRTTRRVTLTRAEVARQPRPKATKPPPTGTDPPASDPSPSEPQPSEPEPTPTTSTKPYKINSTECVRAVPTVGSYFEYTVASGERTVGNHGERCEHFYGNKELNAEGKSSKLAFAVWLPSDFKYVGGGSDWFYVFQAHKTCPCGGWGGPNVGLSIDSEGNFKIKVRALDGKQVYDKTLGAATRGQRHTFLVDAYWSQASDGRLKVEWNGAKVLAYSGPTLFNDDSGGTKIQGGVYRRSTDYQQTVYLVRTHYGSLDALRGWLAALPSGPSG